MRTTMAGRAPLSGFQSDRPRVLGSGSDFRYPVKQDRFSVKGKRCLPFGFNIPKYPVYLFRGQTGFLCHLFSGLSMIQAEHRDVHLVVGKKEVEFVLALLEAVGIRRGTGRKDV